MTVDKELLFKPRLPEADVEVEGIGTVRVRALSRAEAMELQKLESSGMVMVERRMLALALVDPTLTEGEVRQWQEAAPPGELEPVTDKISELSGMTEGAAKEAYKGFDADPVSEFRLPPGGEAGDDGGRDALEDG